MRTVAFWLVWFGVTALVLMDGLPFVSLTPGAKLYVGVVTGLFIGWRAYKVFHERPSDDDTDPNDYYLR